MTANALWSAIVGPALGALPGFALGSWSQRRQWSRDNRRQEWRQLADLASAAVAAGTELSLSRTARHGEALDRAIAELVGACNGRFFLDPDAMMAFSVALGELRMQISLGGAGAALSPAVAHRLVQIHQAIVKQARGNLAGPSRRARRAKSKGKAATGQ